MQTTDREKIEMQNKIVSKTNLKLFEKSERYFKTDSFSEPAVRKAIQKTKKKHSALELASFTSTYMKTLLTSLHGHYINSLTISPQIKKISHIVLHLHPYHWDVN